MHENNYNYGKKIRILFLVVLDPRWEDLQKEINEKKKLIMDIWIIQIQK